MKLLSSTDFILEQSKLINDPEILARVLVQHANFMKQELNVRMFVPVKNVNNEWIILEEPKGKKCCGGIYNDCGCMGELYYDQELLDEYLEAEKRVLFKGFELIGETELSFIFSLNGKFPIIIPKKTNVEFLSLRYKDLLLTESAIKQKGL